MPTAQASDRVSVALCTYNGAAYVGEQVASILAQSRPVDELVLSDDASSDDTVALVRAALAEHNEAEHNTGAHRVKLRVLENRVALGVTANFEQAVSATTGDFIALSDQDDVWHPDKIATLLAVFAAQPDALLAFSNARLVDGSGTPLGRSLFSTLSMTSAEKHQLREGPAFDALLGRNLVTGTTVVFRRDLLDIALPFAPDWVHDEWLAALAAASGGLRMVEQQLVDYRQHGANQIGASSLSLGQKIGRVTEGRTERNARLLARSRELADRIENSAARFAPGVLPQTRAKVAHEELRSSLPASRLRRVAPVARELFSGRYRRYGRGLLDAGRDLVQPAS